MSGPASGVPHILPVSITLSGLANRFAAEGPLQGRIIATSEGLQVLAGQIRIPLSPDTPLQQGQTVDVRVMRDGARLQWHITARPAAPTPSAGIGTLSGAVNNALQALGLTSPQWRTLGPNLVPQNLPVDQVLVQQVLTLYSQPARLGSDIQAVVRMVNGAVAAGVPLGDAATAVQEVVRRMERGSAESFRALMRQVLPGNGRSMAAVLAGLTGAGKGDVAAQLQGDLRQLIGQLLNDEAFMKHLVKSGDDGVFRESADAVLQRLTAAELNNARNLNMPYLFAELPVPEDGELRHAHIHILGEGSGRGAEESGHSVALDIETSKLGPMWIHLRHATGACQCLIRSEQSETVALVKENASALTMALNNIGFKNATVSSEFWDGNRLAAAAKLLHRYAALDEKV